jgi:hypothetical protein
VSAEVKAPPSQPVMGSLPPIVVSGPTTSVELKMVKISPDTLVGILDEREIAK